MKAPPEASGHGERIRGRQRQCGKGRRGEAPTNASTLVAATPDRNANLHAATPIPRAVEVVLARLYSSPFRKGGPEGELLHHALNVRVPRPPSKNGDRRGTTSSRTEGTSVLVPLSQRATGGGFHGIRMRTLENSTLPSCLKRGVTWLRQPRRVSATAPCGGRQLPTSREHAPPSSPAPLRARPPAGRALRGRACVRVRCLRR